MLPRNPPQISSIQWNSAIARLFGAHILQTWEWGKVKSQFGWQTHYMVWYGDAGQYKLSVNHIPERMKHKEARAAALTLQRNIRIGGFARKMGVIYVPKGPLLDWNDPSLRKQVIQDLRDFSQKHSAIFIKIDPDLEVGSGAPGSSESRESTLGSCIINELKGDGWLFSDEQVQFRNTVLISLEASEADLLANMKQKTRYNINLAMRKGVTVRAGTPKDFDMLFRMYAETSIRDGFTIRNDTYYREVWGTFMANQPTMFADQPVADALVAEVDGTPVAGAFIFRFAKKAWYLYGMSSQAHKDKMPNYLLQWEAIKRSKAAGCTTYDLWGAPDEFVESDPLWGVYRFKEGLGGTVHRYLGAWDLPTNRMLYRLYSKTLPGLMDIMRIRGKSSTRQVVG
jgi:lipid II:glycine glycyltransferase (peptidoglycan interpeptide bridge formation enzyme)